MRNPALQSGHRRSGVSTCGGNGGADETGRLDVIIPPQLYEKEREIINGNGILAVRGKLGKEDGVTNLEAETFFPLTLDDAREIVLSHDYH